MQFGEAVKLGRVLAQEDDNTQDEVVLKVNSRENRLHQLLGDLVGSHDCQLDFGIDFGSQRGKFTADQIKQLLHLGGDY